MRDAEDRAEAERMIRLFHDENIDAELDAAAYRPGFDLRDLRILNEAP